MKTLYESILDDEEKLIDRAEKTANNPFELMYLLHEQYKIWKKVPKKRINSIIDSLPRLNRQFSYDLAPDDSLRIYVDGITAFTVTFPHFGFRIAILPTKKI